MQVHKDSSNGAGSNGLRSGIVMERRQEPRKAAEEKRVVSLYAGVGIVKGSDAKSEWQVKLLNLLLKSALHCQIKMHWPGMYSKACNPSAHSCLF